MAGLTLPMRDSGDAFRPWGEFGRTQGKLALINAAVLAANAHNTQPWRFEVGEDAIAIFADAARHIGSFDPFRRELHQSLGCALENLEVAARAQGLSADIKLKPGRLELGRVPDGPAALVTLRPGMREATDAFAAIPQRHTHRGPYQLGRPVPEPTLAALKVSVRNMPAELVLMTGTRKEALANLILSATKAIIDDPEMSGDNARWFRFRQREIDQSRDGLTLDANVPGRIQNFFAKLFPPSRESADRHWLHGTERIQLATAPLLGIIAVRDPHDRPTALAVGRLWQRLHLLLASQGLAAQPLNQPIERMDRERQLGQSAATAQALGSLMSSASAVPTFIFRAGYAVRAAPASPRRPVADVVIQDNVAGPPRRRGSLLIRGHRGS